RAKVRLGDLELVAGAATAEPEGDVRVAIRPERVGLEPAGATGENRVPGTVERTVYVGATLQVFVRLATGATIQAWLPNLGGGVPHEQGAAVVAHLPVDALRVVPDAAV
ncbi:MAG: TOBE domain-containing protein, partial [Actinomycetota bacterium]